MHILLKSFGIAEVTNDFWSMIHPSKNGISVTLELHQAGDLLVLLKGIELGQQMHFQGSLGILENHIAIDLFISLRGLKLCLRRVSGKELPLNSKDVVRLQLEPITR